MSKCVVVFSGGQDSTTCLYWAKQNYSSVSAITFQYGQKHQAEINAAKKISELAGVVEHWVVDVTAMLKAKSALTDPEQNPGVFSQASEGRPNTWVPLRNAVFLNVAANYAVSWGSSCVVTGVSQEDGANYPDTTNAFIVAQQNAITLALGDVFEIKTPLMHKTKKQTVLFAKEITGCMEALKFSHTCYNGMTPPCGRCHSCVLRAQGFASAGIIDPIKMEG